jgi:hypothetical protein
MPSTLCQLLEDYMNHDLTPADCARFETHLRECAPCRQALGEERDLDALLSTALREPLPGGFEGNFQLRLRAAKRRRLIAAMVAVAASVALIVLVFRPFRTPDQPPPAPHVEALPAPPPSSGPPPAAQAQVRFPKNAGVVAVPVPSDSPNVTIVQVYPALHKVSWSKNKVSAERRIP